MNDISHKIESYIDGRNRELWEELSSEYKIDLFHDPNEYSWLVEITTNAAQIICPDLQFNIPSFTHELLHVKLDKLGMTNYYNLSDYLAQSDIFQNFPFRHFIFSIHNFHSHKKMYPFFKEMGFRDEDFIGTREGFSLVEHLQLKICLKTKLLRAFGIEGYLGKFFALKNDFMPNDRNRIEGNLKKLKKIDERLYNVGDTFDAEWNERWDYNYLESLELFSDNLKLYMANKYGR